MVIPYFLFFSALSKLCVASDPTNDKSVARNEQQYRIDALKQTAELLKSQNQNSDAAIAYMRLFELTQETELLIELGELYVKVQNIGALEDLLRMHKGRFSDEDYARFEEKLQQMNQTSSEVKDKTDALSDSDFVSPALNKSSFNWQQALVYGLGGIGALGGVLAGVEAMQIRNNIDENYCRYGSSGKLVCMAEARPLLRSERNMATMSDVGWLILGGAFGVGVSLSRQMSVQVQDPNDDEFSFLVFNDTESAPEEQ